MTKQRKVVLAGAAILLLAAGGCVVVADDDHGHYDDDAHHDDDGGVVTVPTDPYYTTIDRDHFLSTELGQGAGMFVEYAEGGVWTLWTSCDTELYGEPCFWRAWVIVHDAVIDSHEELELEADDYLVADGAALTLDWVTNSDSDKVTFTTEPGALVEIHMALDGAVTPQYFVWYGNEQVREGAPSSPVVFQPDAP